MLKAIATLRTIGEDVAVDVVWTADGAPVATDCVWTFSGTKADRRIATRFVAAINAQAVFAFPAVVTDADGRTHVASQSRVWARSMAADLKRLGF